MAFQEPSTLAKEREKFLYGLFCNGLWQRRAECQKKGRRIKGEMLRRKTGFLSNGVLSSGYAAGNEDWTSQSPSSPQAPSTENSPSSWPYEAAEMLTPIFLIVRAKSQAPWNTHFLVSTIHMTSYHIKRAKCLYWSSCGLLCSQGLWGIKWIDVGGETEAVE